MDAGTPGEPDDNGQQRRRARVAASCEVAGAVLALVTLTCTLLGAISAQQAIALGLPAALLIVGGLIGATVPDAAESYQRGLRAGRRVGSVLNRWRSMFRRRRNER
jgi:hypothetical protein